MIGESSIKNRQTYKTNTINLNSYTDILNYMMGNTASNDNSLIIHNAINRENNIKTFSKICKAIFTENYDVKQLFLFIVYLRGIEYIESKYNYLVEILVHIDNIPAYNDVCLNIYLYLRNISILIKKHKKQSNAINRSYLENIIKLDEITQDTRNNLKQINDINEIGSNNHMFNGFVNIILEVKSNESIFYDKLFSIYQKIFNKNQTLIDCILYNWIIDIIHILQDNGLTNIEEKFKESTPKIYDWIKTQCVLLYRKDGYVSNVIEIWKLNGYIYVDEDTIIGDNINFFNATKENFNTVHFNDDDNNLSFIEEKKNDKKVSIFTLLIAISSGFIYFISSDDNKENTVETKPQNIKNTLNDNKENINNDNKRKEKDSNVANNKKKHFILDL